MTDNEDSDPDVTADDTGDPDNASRLRIKVKTILGFLVICYITVASALLGYDCESTAANITTVSLLEAGECDLPKTTVNKTKTYLQLLQLIDYDNTMISGFQINTTDFRNVTLASSFNIDGRCQGTQYSDADSTWKSVVVQAVVRTNIRTHTGIVKIKDNSISLRGHLQCPFLEETGFTDENGNAFWTVLPGSACNFKIARRRIMIIDTGQRVEPAVSTRKTLVFGIQGSLGMSYQNCIRHYKAYES
ncbi:hypothetical protein M0804_014056 [Polistes exclamans]|nr:hypothetical protein M0804_014056 [Polistes exclamans]